MFHLALHSADAFLWCKIPYGPKGSDKNTETFKGRYRKALLASKEFIRLKRSAPSSYSLIKENFMASNGLSVTYKTFHQAFNNFKIFEEKRSDRKILRSNVKSHQVF